MHMVLLMMKLSMLASGEMVYIEGLNRSSSPSSGIPMELLWHPQKGKPRETLLVGRGLEKAKRKGKSETSVLWSQCYKRCQLRHNSIFSRENPETRQVAKSLESISQKGVRRTSSIERDRALVLRCKRITKQRADEWFRKSAGKQQRKECGLEGMAGVWFLVG